jgi:rRNA-processing protein FCF1
MRLFMDTNFVIDLLRFKVDLDQVFDLEPEIVICSTRQVVNELKSIANKRTRDGNLARLGVQFVERHAKIVDVESNKADASLLKAVATGDMVATNDTALRRRLAERGVKTIYLRARKHLAIL